MKRIISLLCILLLLCSQALAFSPAFLQAVSDGTATVTWIPKDDANCMGAYHMTDAETERDVSGEGTTLSYAGTFAASTDNPPGYTGDSRVNNGVEYLEAANGSTIDIYGANQTLSICAWVRIDTDMSADQMIIQNYLTTGDKRQWRLYFDDSSDALVFQISPDGTTTGLATATGATGRAGAFATGTWAHVAVVYNDTNIQLYVNGEADGDAVAYTSGCADKATTVRVGLAADNTLPLRGTIDELIIFNRALSAGEVSSVYTNGINGLKTEA
jgi:hypothetical protein